MSEVIRGDHASCTLAGGGHMQTNPGIVEMKRKVCSDLSNCLEIVVLHRIMMNMVSYFPNST